MTDTRKPIPIDGAFEEEARAMVRALNTGELPSESATYYVRVKRLAAMHWAEKIKRDKGRHGEEQS
jgi:hypothetical protein